MATWNQSINGGGLLAGIGGNNTNAPQASDANAALSFIHQNNEDAWSGRNNIGLQALQGVAGNLQMYKQAQQAERQKEFEQAYGNAYASGDRTALRNLAVQYPEQIEAVRSGMKFVDEDQRNTVGNLAAGARLAAASPEAMGTWLQNNAADLQRVGLDPAEVAQTYQQNPQGFGEFADHLGMAALGPDQYFAAQDKIVGQRQNQQKIEETARSNRAGEALQARGQDITVRGQDISRQNALTSAYAPTAAMQNYSRYAQMLKEDPAGAAAFAQAAGINTSAKKLMSVKENDDGSVTKYYTDGTEEQGGSNQPITGEGIRPISLPAAQKVMEKAPEGAKKAAGFAYRVRNNLDAIDNISKTVDPNRIALINSAFGNGTLSNLNLSEAEQQYVALASDAIGAVLRQETGAAITAPEMTDYYKRYFPQVGDSAGTIKTKRNMMENQFKSLKAASGRSYDALQVMSAAEQPQATQSQQPAANQRQSQPQTLTSKSGIQFTVK